MTGAHEMPTPDAVSSTAETYARAVETEPSVTVTEETFFGHGWQPQTITVLQAIWFLPQGAQFGVEDLVDWFRSLGWKSANGKPLGEDAVRREMALIRKSGYVRARRLRGEGGRVAGIRYEVSKRARPDASAGQRFIGFEGDESETRRSDHVPPSTTHGDPPHVVDEAKPQVGPCAVNDQAWSMAGVVEHEKPQVAPCASNGGYPPHPPEEEGTTSPYPLMPEAADGREGEGSAITEEQIAAASVFLEELPDPWCAGPATARKLSPKLAAAVAERGWELDDALVRKLTYNPDGIRSFPKVLAARIDDLPRKGSRSRKPPGQRSNNGVPQRPENVVCSEEGMGAVRAALEAFRQGGKRP
ncbi:hypothetical protein [Streptomyces sp. NPDC017529]|uniref:hypothetical protein n=1 Tax=Streptomyces sp. NPDC017529 TaxID=3365000 RepID=UPI0037B54B44